jgi:hypothetical protein
MTARLSRWIWWAAASLGVWIAWGFAVQMPLQRRSDQLTPRVQEVSREVQKLSARLGAVPIVLAQLDSARTQLATRLDSYVEVEHIEKLMAEVIRQGHANGLDNVRVQPDLEHLLVISSPKGGLAGEFRIDTIPMTMSAQGRFTVLGRWMEQIEARPDFRLWQHGQWTSMDDGLTSVVLRGAFIVVNRQAHSFANAAEATEGP